MDRLFAAGVERFGRVDGATNLIAGSFMLKPAHLTSDAELDETLALNVKTAFGTIKGAARHMPKGGSVVLISSVAARVGLADRGDLGRQGRGHRARPRRRVPTYLPASFAST